MNDFIRRQKQYSDKPIVRNSIEHETVEQFLARGGKIETVKAGDTNLDPSLGIPKNLAESMRSGAHRSFNKRKEKQ